MPACIPDDPDYCFRPAPEGDDEPAQIRILLGIKGFAFAIPTALVALSHADGLALCDRLNRRLGHRDRGSWTAFAARCLRAGAGGMNGSTLH